MGTNLATLDTNPSFLALHESVYLVSTRTSLVDWRLTAAICLKAPIVFGLPLRAWESCPGLGATHLGNNVGGRLEEAHVAGHKERRRDGRVEVAPRNDGKGCDESNQRQPIRDAERHHTRVGHDGAAVVFRGSA